MHSCIQQSKIHMHAINTYQMHLVACIGVSEACWMQFGHVWFPTLHRISGPSELKHLPARTTRNDRNGCFLSAWLTTCRRGYSKKHVGEGNTALSSYKLRDCASSRSFPKKAAGGIGSPPVETVALFSSLRLTAKTSAIVLPPSLRALRLR